MGWRNRSSDHLRVNADTARAAILTPADILV
jgi:hypothetical protein